MAGGERRGAEIARGRQKIAKLDPLIAADAGDRRLAAAIAISEIVDDLPLEPALVIENVMGDAETLCDAPGIGDVLASAARALAPRSRAMVVELQRDADDLKAALHQQGRRHRRINPARHRDDHAMVSRTAGEVEI